MYLSILVFNYILPYQSLRYDFVLEPVLLWTDSWGDDTDTSSHWTVVRAGLLWWLSLCRLQIQGDQPGKKYQSYLSNT